MGCRESPAESFDWATIASGIAHERGRWQDRPDSGFLLFVRNGNHELVAVDGESLGNSKNHGTATEACEGLVLTESR